MWDGQGLPSDSAGWISRSRSCREVRQIQLSEFREKHRPPRGPARLPYGSDAKQRLCELRNRRMNSYLFCIATLRCDTQCYYVGSCRRISGETHLHTDFLECICNCAHPRKHSGRTTCFARVATKESVEQSPRRILEMEIHEYVYAKEYPNFVPIKSRSHCRTYIHALV